MWPALAFVALAGVWTFPLALRMATNLPGAAPGDNVAFAWNFWWMRQALTTTGVTFFHTDRLFAPFGIDLTLHTHTALPAFVGATLLVRSIGHLQTLDPGFDPARLYSLQINLPEARYKTPAARTVFLADVSALLQQEGQNGRG